MLDASNAFDGVNLLQLLKKLLQRVCPYASVRSNNAYTLITQIYVYLIDDYKRAINMHIIYNYNKYNKYNNKYIINNYTYNMIENKCWGKYIILMCFVDMCGGVCGVYV